MHTLFIHLFGHLFNPAFNLILHPFMQHMSFPKGLPLNYCANTPQSGSISVLLRHAIAASSLGRYAVAFLCVCLVSLLSKCPHHWGRSDTAQDM